MQATKSTYNNQINQTPTHRNTTSNVNNKPKEKQLSTQSNFQTLINFKTTTQKQTNRQSETPLYQTRQLKQSTPNAIKHYVKQINKHTTTHSQTTNTNKSQNNQTNNRIKTTNTNQKANNHN